MNEKEQLISVLLSLKEEEMLILAYLKAQPHRRTIAQMSEDLNREIATLLPYIENLKEKRYIRQDSTDIRQYINWDDEGARYYTEPGDVRDQIENLFEFDELTKSIKVKGNYIWYVAYGSNMLYERFMHYINGGVCRFNQHQYDGCRDKTPPLAIRKKIIPYEMYIARQSESWHQSGVAFIDSHREGKTWGKMYLISGEQFKDVQKQEGVSWYDTQLELGEYLGIPIKTLTNAKRQKENNPSLGYQVVVEAGIRETYTEVPEEEILQYLKEIFKEQIHQEQSVQAFIDNEVKYAHSLSLEQRNKLLESAPQVPQYINVNTKSFLRNQVVVVERLARSRGYCEKCGAPFIRKSDGTPYLEVHHIIPLSEGGMDHIDNTIALCPNCHREMHLG